MAIIQIPVTSNIPDSQFSIDLQGTVYLLRFKLNERINRFTMDILLEDGTPLVEGVMITADWLFMDRFKDSRLPAGKFLVIDNEDLSREPGVDSFGVTHTMVYVEA